MKRELVRFGVELELAIHTTTVLDKHQSQTPWKRITTWSGYILHLTVKFPGFAAIVTWTSKKLPMSGICGGLSPLVSSGTVRISMELILKLKQWRWNIIFTYNIIFVILQGRKPQWACGSRGEQCPSLYNCHELSCHVSERTCNKREPGTLKRPVSVWNDVSHAVIDQCLESDRRWILLVPHGFHKLTVTFSSILSLQYGYFDVGMLF